MSTTNEAVLSGLLNVYEQDYTSQRKSPRNYTVFNESINDYVTYSISSKATPDDLDSTLQMYMKTCGDNVEFKHDNIRISRWKNSWQGPGMLKLW